MIKKVSETQEYMVYDGEVSDCIGCPSSKIGLQIVEFAKRKKIVWVGPFSEVCNPPRDPNIIALHGIIPEGATWAELVQKYVDNLNKDRQVYNEALKRVKAVQSYSVYPIIQNEKTLYVYYDILKDIKKPNLIAFLVKDALIVGEHKKRKHEEFYPCKTINGNEISYRGQECQIDFVLGEPFELPPASMLTADNFHKEERHYLVPITCPPRFSVTLS